MHFYPHHIGDYRAATAHLSNEQDLCYRRLLDMYYDTETALSTDLVWLARRLRVDPTTVEQVLNDMFEQRDEGWFHHRCNVEIDAYKSKKIGASKAGKASAAIRNIAKNNDSATTVQRTFNDRSTNHEPLTKNQEPLTKKRNTEYNAPPDGVAVDVWHDFLKLRKAKRAPIGKTVVELIRREANKAGISLGDAMQMCVERGWSSFRSDWLKPSHLVVAKGQPLSFAEQDRRAGIKRWEQMTNEVHPDSPDYLDDGQNVIDVVDQALARLSA